MKRLEEATTLASEILEIAASTGTNGVTRTFSALDALTKLAVRTAQTYADDPAAPPPTPASALRQTFEALGATYVKLGQFIASAPSAFPKEFVDEFQKCLDETPATPFAEMRAIVEEELREKGAGSVEDVFSFVDPTPLASASVAQVHRATLRGSNKDVVIKILKPDVEATLSADLSFALVAAKVLQFLNPELSRASLVDIVGDVRASMLEETDFRKEAENVAAFTRYLEQNDLSGVATAPYVYERYSGKRVMTMEFLDGVALTDLDAIKGVSSDPELTLVNALNVWFGSVLACESFHADVHAGNLLVLRDTGKIGFIDFGIVGRVSPSTWNAMQTFLQSTVSREYDRMALALVTMGAADDDVDVEKFARDLKRVYDAIDAVEPSVVVSEDLDTGAQRASVAVDQQEIATLVTELIVVGEENGVKFPREFGLLLKQVLYFDRYVQLLAPDLQVVDDDRLEFMDAVAVDVQPKRLA